MSSSRDREALRGLLKQRGILYASDIQPIRHRDGALAPWAFYSWNVTLTSEGLRLAALCLLERSATFRATQLATYGYTGMPLLAACVLLGDGRYTGVCVREQRKAYLSGRRVEGTLDRNAPVIIIDDSISSGTSLDQAIRAIEAEGVEVEGSIALVNFPLRGGIEWANARGYRAEAVFDIWTDLDMAKTLAPRPAPPSLAYGSKPAPEGLHPAALARFAAEFVLRHGCAPLPPRRMDRDYEGHGGVFVSFRQRRTDYRLARDGFWHFSPDAADPCRDVVTATVNTVQGAHGAISDANLADLKIAVTFLTALELVPPCKLDFDRYGIVVRSRIFPHKLGGALPNTQVFISEIEQYRHAREVNAQVQPYEPHDLFRHDLVKCVEPGETWLPYGVHEGHETAWWSNQSLGEQLVARARGQIAVVLGKSDPAGNAIPDRCIPCPISGVAVRIYRNGLAGYGVQLGSDLDAALLQAARQAASDRRYNEQRVGRAPDEFTVVVSVLHHPELLGNQSISAVARKLRRGLDALGVERRGRTSVLLPSALTYNNWSREQFVETLLAISGIDRPPRSWTTWQVAEWVDTRGQTLPLRFGFPNRPAGPIDIERYIRLLGSYVQSAVGADGLPWYYSAPFAHEPIRNGTAARTIHALMALDLAGAFLDEPAWRATARQGYACCLKHVRDGTVDLPGRAGGALADCVLLAGLAQNPEFAFSPQASALAKRLRRMIRPDGRISDVPKRLDLPDDQDFVPGAVLWALGNYAHATRSPALPNDHLEACLDWYRCRFRAVPNWGMVGWQPQGWRAVSLTASNAGFEALAFDAVDWALERQLEKNGAFLEELSPDEPSFNTAFIAEGVTAAWALALGKNDATRAGRYARAWREAISFLTRLVIHAEDTFAMRDASRAVGGVRTMLTRSDVRIDQVSHCLHALVQGGYNARRGL